MDVGALDFEIQGRDVGFKPRGFRALHAYDLGCRFCGGFGGCDRGLYERKLEGFFWWASSLGWKEEGSPIYLKIPVRWKFMGWGLMRFSVKVLVRSKA